MVEGESLANYSYMNVYTEDCLHVGFKYYRCLRQKVVMREVVGRS